MNCWHCNTELIWGGDHDIDEEEDCEYSIVTNLSCPNCECMVEVYLPKEKEKTMNKQLIEAVKEASISIACCLDEVSDVTEADLLHIQEQITHIENHLDIDRNWNTTVVDARTYTTRNE